MALETHTHFYSVETPEGRKQLAFQMWQRSASETAPVLICVHGLTRNRHDFDEIASALASHYRVVTVDMIGRGDSDWLSDPTHYGYPLYISLMQQLMTHLEDITGEDRFDWLGTSMGGLIGMMIAASPATQIDRLVLNDIGPEIPVAGLKRLADYVGQAPAFSSLGEVEDYLRVIAAGFGQLSDAQWRTMATHAARKDESGNWRLTYDPAISNAFDGLSEDIDLTGIWKLVSCPVLVIRGEQSDLLTEEGLVRMCERKNTYHVTIPDAGHAPALLSDEEISAVRDFLTT